MSELVSSQSAWRGRCAVGILAAIVGVTMVLSFDEYRFLNDASQYVSTARNIRDAGEISTSCLFYGEHLVSGEVPAPQTVFPPAFPGLMALVSAVAGLELRYAAFAINLASFLLSAVVVYELCLSLGSRSIGGAVAAFCWLITGVLWHVTWWGLSEPLFMLLMLLSVWLLARRTLPLALLAGVCASAAIAVRYAGLFLVAAAAVNYAILLVWTRDKRLVPEALSFGVPPALTAWMLLSRNADLVGSAPGGNTYQLGESVTKVLVRLASSGTELFGFSRAFLLSGDVAEYVAGMTIIFGVLLVSRFLADRERRVQTLAFFRHPVRLLTLVFLPVYIASITSLEYLTGSGLSDRLVMPILPFAIALFAALVSQVQQPKASGFLLRGMCLLLVCGFGIGQFRAYQKLSGEAAVAPVLQRTLQSAVVSDQTVMELLRSRITNEQPLLANQPQLVHGLLKRPVVGLATGRYSTCDQWTPQHVEEDIISRFNIGYVLLCRSPGVIDQTTSEFFLGLARGRIPNRLKPVFENEDLLLFKVIDPIHSSSL